MSNIRLMTRGTDHHYIDIILEKHELSCRSLFNHFDQALMLWNE